MKRRSTLILLNALIIVALIIVVYFGINYFSGNYSYAPSDNDLKAGVLVDNTQSGGALSTPPAETSPQTDAELRALIKERIDDNLRCTNMFFFDRLPLKDPPITVPEKSKFVEVKSDEYKSLDDIKNFLANIYVKKEVDNLLYKYPYGKPIYSDVNGKLCVDFSILTAQRGYYLIWDDYTFDYRMNDDGTLTVDIHIRMLKVPDDDKTVPHTVTVKMVQENGTWKFKKMFYE